MHNNAKTIVIKIGTSTLTYETGMLNLRKIEEICKIISDLKNSGKRIVLVTSGAVSAGWVKLGHTARPSTLEELQAAAAVGQCELMSLYDRYIIGYGHVVAQILLTRDAVENPERRRNAENTFRLLLERGCVPIVNENDAISSDEIRFGDNDTLSAYVAVLSGADLLINLSDIDALYDSDPRRNPGAKKLTEITDVESVYRMAEGSGTLRGTGGMVTKLDAAKIAGDAGIYMMIASGREPEILYRIIGGENVGTLFIPKSAQKA